MSDLLDLFDEGRDGMVAFPVPLSIALLYAVSSGTGFDAARTFDPYAVTTSAAAVENSATNKPLATGFTSFACYHNIRRDEVYLWGYFSCSTPYFTITPCAVRLVAASALLRKRMWLRLR